MSTDEGSQIGARCRQRRKAQKLTLAQVASVVGVTKGHLSRFERGEKTLSLAVLLRLASALGTSICTLSKTSSTGAGVRVKHARKHRASTTPDGIPDITYDLLTATETSQSSQIVMVNIPPNTELPEPAYHGGQESLFVISGTALLMVADACIELSKGDFVRFSGHQLHNFKTGDQACELLLVIE